MFFMDLVKEAFQKVKEDIESLKQELNSLKSDLSEINNKISQNNRGIPSTNNLKIPTIRHTSSTHPYPFKALKPQKLHISIGNQGASTNRQTDKQTNRHTPVSYGTTENSMENALDILDSLDNIKKEIRLKFKRLTEQEFLVFSSIYQFDEELGYSDYKLLSERLNLTESSIRDYVRRLIKKGIAVDKTKVNNKYVKLNISAKLKKIVSLPTILQLREL